jgi:hypothetical protein
MNQYAGTYLGTLSPTTSVPTDFLALADGTDYFGYPKITSFAAPAQTFLLGDVNWDDEVWPSFNLSMVHADEWCAASGFPSTAHNMGGGFSFADGHVILKHRADPRTAQITFDEKTESYVNYGQPNNPDLQWLHTVSTDRKDGQPLTLSVAPSR